MGSLVNYPSCEIFWPAFVNQVTLAADEGSGRSFPSGAH